MDFMNIYMCLDYENSVFSKNSRFYFIWKNITVSSHLFIGNPMLAGNNMR